MFSSSHPHYCKGFLQFNIKSPTKPQHPGGRRFNTEIGVPFTLQTMGTINNFIWKLFRQPSDSQRKYVPVLNWSGQGTAPGGLTEGIADYVMIKSTYYDPQGYTKPGQGGRWDEGYGVTARFLEYCDSLRNGFTPELNNKMRKVYKDEYFQELLGKPLRQVWSEYKAKYGNIPAGSAGAGGALSDYVQY
ncbi:UNVERIFIED_CONTAM: Basic secretory protease [Sesamum latifolium]|uniref:Basic secretory protease n=1 Tax=Sesamum latifolium TaxID=2727402 RepID=A0AAW2V506_9LAMI